MKYEKAQAIVNSFSHKNFIMMSANVIPGTASTAAEAQSIAEQYARSQAGGGYKNCTSTVTEDGNYYVVTVTASHNGNQEQHPPKTYKVAIQHV